LVVLDPRLKLAIDVIPCEDAHAQERTLIPELLKTVERNDLWIADRNFCTLDFLFEIHVRHARFVIRQHGNLPIELMGRRKFVGTSATGKVYEQAARITHPDGRTCKIRRITVELDVPTRDGEQDLHIVTNLPRRMSGMKVSELYRERWTIEIAFNEMAQNLEGEIETLGYPRAALFGFCMALVAHNLLAVIKAAMRSANGVDTVEADLSTFYVCDEIAATHRGMTIAIRESYWTKKYADLTPKQMACELIRIAKNVDPTRYRKHKRGPKKPPKKMNKTKRAHVSTARVLLNR
jgi:hypothetical protein